MPYANPVIRGHAPDPSVVRVGEDYFVANSSFGMLPGIPIRHSTDLVNWRLIGHAVTRPAQYRRDGRPGPVELFAPTIRHHDGTFFAVCTNAHPGQGNFLVTTNNPAGEWSDAMWIDDEGFDPSLFRDDDGTWYYQRRSLEFGRPDGMLGPIVQAEIDVTTGRLGPLLPITAGAGGFVTNDIEGPHVFRRGDWYYLTGAEGSSWKGHLQSIARSRSPWGPFEPAPHNPIVTHRDRVGHPIQSLGHVDFVEAGDGRWWALALGTRHAPLVQHHNIGRETFLLPVEWGRDAWPVLGQAGTTELVVDAQPPEQGAEPAAGARPGSPAMQGWMTIGAAPTGFDSHQQGGGRLIVPAGADLDDTRRPIGALVRAQTADDETLTATVPGGAPGSVGVAVFTNRTHHFSAIVSGVDDARTIAIRRRVDDLEMREEVPVPGIDPIVLQITARPDSYSFTATSDAGRVVVGSASARLLSAEVVEWFQSVHFALVHVGPDGAPPAEFRDVATAELEPLPPAIVPPFIRELL